MEFIVPFVKLDCGILNSTIWFDSDARIVFLTALLMAKPFHVKEPLKVIKHDKIEDAGWEIPPGWYGKIEAAGPGIVRMACLENTPGMEAIGRLCSPDPDSRSREFEGRRMGRVDGGYIVLNFQRYRDKDHTNAVRQARFRERHAALPESGITLRNGVTITGVTQAEAEEESTKTKTEESTKTNTLDTDVSRAPKIIKKFTPPTLEEVVAYVRQKGFRVDPVKWHAYYESNGWRVGRNPMKSWRSAVVTWSRNPETRGNGGKPARPFDPGAQNSQPGICRICEGECDVGQLYCLTCFLGIGGKAEEYREVDHG